MKHSLVVPAIIPTDVQSIEVTLRQLGPCSEIHLDVVDGVFVPFTSWPYRPFGYEQEVFDLFASYTLEVDLMVEDAYEAGRRWVEAGADMLVFHIESIDPALLEAFSASYDVTIGISLNADTPIEALIPYVPYSDYVQLMGIKEIGVQGQPFDEGVLERIDGVRALMPTHFVSIDGSVNAATIPFIKQHAPDRYIVGSAIVKAAEPRRAFEALHTLVSSTG